MYVCIDEMYVWKGVFLIQDQILKLFVTWTEIK